MHPDSVPDAATPPASPWRLPVLLLVLLAVYAVTVNYAKQRREHSLVGAKHLGVGGKLADFEMEPLINTTSKVTATDLKDKIVLLNYWGPWCGPCLQEFPELAELEKQYRTDSRLKFLLVSSDGGAGQTTEELASDTQDVLNRHQSKAPIYHDPKRSALSSLMVSARLAEFGFPTTIIADQSGVICGVWQGYDPYTVEEMRIMIQQLLGKQATP